MYNTFFTNCYITDCCVTHAAADPRARRPPIFVRTDKQAPTDQGLQAYCYITNSGIAVCCCDLDPREDALLSEQTSKHPVNKGFQSIPHSYIIRTSRCGPGRPGKLLSEQTSKQLSTGCPQSVVSYQQVTAE